ncbi:TlpA disulfide reductase family protein [Hoylesella loescheii]|uniref:peroxiredoxin family protein n=1 Tax=Hoylesella loescheii TaxID=840 RepID=UPI0028EAD064|nr:TlpA disulfide reductase family protein [Hoylesella loescheii]
MEIKHKRRTATALLVALSLWCLNAKAQQATEVDLDEQYATELLKPGTVAPDFELPSPDGKKVSLSQFKGKYVVLDFWASWCPDCRKDAPNIVAMYNRFKDKGVAFVGVSFDIDAALWKAAIDKYGMKYAHVSELKKMREANISKAYGVKWIPSMVLIDPEGKVVMGTVLSKKLERKLEELLQ